MDFVDARTASTADANEMPRPSTGNLSIQIDSKKDVSPMAAILRSRGHLQSSSAIPGLMTALVVVVQLTSLIIVATVLTY